jgi:hypothetical protein
VVGKTISWLILACLTIPCQHVLYQSAQGDMCCRLCVVKETQAGHHILHVNRSDCSMWMFLIMSRHWIGSQTSMIVVIYVNRLAWYMPSIHSLWVKHVRPPPTIEYILDFRIEESCRCRIGGRHRGSAIHPNNRFHPALEVLWIKTGGCIVGAGASTNGS